MTWFFNKPLSQTLILTGQEILGRSSGVKKQLLFENFNLNRTLNFDHTGQAAFTGFELADVFEGFLFAVGEFVEIFMAGDYPTE